MGDVRECPTNAKQTPFPITQASFSIGVLLNSFKELFAGKRGAFDGRRIESRKFPALHESHKSFSICPEPEAPCCMLFLFSVALKKFQRVTLLPPLGFWR